MKTKSITPSFIRGMFGWMMSAKKPTEPSKKSMTRPKGVRLTGGMMAPNGRTYSIKRNGQVVRAIPKPWTCKAERKWMKKMANNPLS